MKKKICYTPRRISYITLNLLFVICYLIAGCGKDSNPVSGSNGNNGTTGEVLVFDRNGVDSCVGGQGSDEKVFTGRFDFCNADSIICYFRANTQAVPNNQMNVIGIGVDSASLEIYGKLIYTNWQTGNIYYRVAYVSPKAVYPNIHYSIGCGNTQGFLCVREFKIWKK